MFMRAASYFFCHFPFLYRICFTQPWIIWFLLCFFLHNWCLSFKGNYYFKVFSLYDVSMKLKMTKLSQPKVASENYTKGTSQLSLILILFLSIFPSNLRCHAMPTWKERCALCEILKGTRLSQNRRKPIFWV